MMLSEIVNEAFRYLDRALLEGLQMHPRYLRDHVNVMHAPYLYGAFTESR